MMIEQRYASNGKSRLVLLAFISLVIFCVWLVTGPLFSGLQPGDTFTVLNIRQDERLFGAYDWKADKRASYRVRGIPRDIKVKYLMVEPEQGIQALGKEGELWTVEFVEYVQKLGFFSGKQYLVGKWIKSVSNQELSER